MERAIMLMKRLVGDKWTVKEPDGRGRSYLRNI